ncbi:hypothetical protein [Roseisolibacter sp. H3M3-2]|uniref:hypothetical protein n=1 Tax=Roseisolibacter sp. H3M3-2 TaxID=3031323 RepID=UPI0023DADA87|nr:hypothetical protein [Roseisolibacter sp. H3M3-2]MDF1502900.1 hypothetical protein [Roseisolibacter sp. H3M3-2]
MSPSGSAPSRPPRAPALYVTGSPAAGAPPLSFRLPVPPSWDDRPPTARAAERRARKAYFAALDALYRGEVNEDAAGKLRRLVEDVRSLTARGALEHLLDVLGFVRRTAPAGPVLAAPTTPCERVAVGVPPRHWTTDRARLAERYAWPMEWLRMHRFVAGKALVIDWYPLPESAAAAPTVRPLPARSRRRLQGAA